MRLAMSRERRRALIVLLISLLIALTAGFGFAPSIQTPAQPIPFSHQIHVTTKQLNCFFCHNSAAISSNAGMPSVDKCLLCHSKIATRFPPIYQITAYAQAGKPIPWVRVNKVPEFVRFAHQPHIAKGVDCGQCHGNVSAMDRIRAPSHAFNMNFCVQCHWKNGASADCSMCHY